MAASKALNIKDQLYEDLKDPAYASAYINEAILDGDEAVLKTALCSKGWHQSRYCIQNAETWHRVIIHYDARFAQSL
jgi:hypothetical protein